MPQGTLQADAPQAASGCEPVRHRSAWPPPRTGADASHRRSPRRAEPHPTLPSLSSEPERAARGSLERARRRCSIGASSTSRRRAISPRPIAMIAALDVRSCSAMSCFQRYMHPTAYRSSYAELADWLEHYADHPDADQVYRLALRRRPPGAARPQPPVRGYLGGAGQELQEVVRPAYRTDLERSSAEEAAVRRWRLGLEQLVADGRPEDAEAALDRRRDHASARSGGAVISLAGPSRAVYVSVGDYAKALSLAGRAAARSGRRGPGNPLDRRAQRLATGQDSAGGLAFLEPRRGDLDPARGTLAGGVLGGARLSGRLPTPPGQPFPAHRGGLARLLRPAGAHRARRNDHLRERSGRPQGEHAPGAAALSGRPAGARARPDRPDRAGRAGDPQARQSGLARADGRPDRARRVPRPAGGADAPCSEPRRQRWQLPPRRPVPAAQLAAGQRLHRRPGAGLLDHARRSPASTPRPRAKPAPGG